MELSQGWYISPSPEPFSLSVSPTQDCFSWYLYDQSPSKFQVTDQDIEHLEGLSLGATAEPGHDGDDEKAVIRSKTGKLTPEPSPDYDEMKIVSMSRRPTSPYDTNL